MKVSTRGQYGVRAMVELSMKYGDGPLPLKIIAERQELSENYLEQLLGSLRKAGLIDSVRGAHGGYELSKKPEKIKIGDIIRGLEGPIAPVDCVDDSAKKKVCHRIDRCVTHLLWEELRESIRSVLDSTTLQDLCDKAEKLKAKGEYMYYI